MTGWEVIMGISTIEKPRAILLNCYFCQQSINRLQIVWCDVKGRPAHRECVRLLTYILRPIVGFESYHRGEMAWMAYGHGRTYALILQKALVGRLEYGRAVTAAMGH